jgi:organic radical activating enzyme
MLKFLRFWAPGQSLTVKKLVIKTGTACSLRCEKCGELNPYFKKIGRGFSLPAARLIEDVSILASFVKNIDLVHVAGGEPFIHKDLAEFIRRMAAFPKIGKIEIVTNGTIVPDIETLDILEKLGDKIIVLISDYGGAGVDNKGLLCALKEKNINHRLQKDMVWKDQSDTSFKGLSRNRLIDIAKKCTSFRDGYFTLVDGRLTSHCSKTATLLYYLDMYDKYPGMFIDIRKTNKRSFIKKLKKLIDFQYTPMCNYCVPIYEAKDCEAGRQI